jgi:hypothetical protein
VQCTGECSGCSGYSECNEWCSEWRSECSECSERSLESSTFLYATPHLAARVSEAWAEKVTSAKLVSRVITTVALSFHDMR